MESWGLTTKEGDVELVTSELVNNAIKHGGGVTALALSAGPGYVRVEVGDADHREPLVDESDPMLPHGHGLQLVAALSRSWGSYPTGQGKTVWAEVALDDRP